LTDYYAEPWDYNYNYPQNAFPYNGIVMPPLTTPEYIDYDSLPELSKQLISLGPHTDFKTFPNTLTILPNIDDTLSNGERKDLLTRAIKANAVMAYLAAIRFADEQLGRLIDSLSQYPAIYNNTVIIVTSDHGFTLSEKKHWGKGTLYESDARVPFIIADLRTASSPKVCNRVVSLLDLFPTIVELAEASPALDIDGETPYADGHSIVPLLENPALQWERGALTEVKESFDGFVCFPQSSVRTEKFRYIRYASNNAEGLVECDAGASYAEKELYEIGENREVDPNEWNNLADNPDYAPVIQYLEEMLPGGSLYLKKTLKATISVNGSVCMYDNDDVIKLRSKLYSADGVQLTGAGLSPYTFTWTNNLTGASFTGRNYNFSMSSIPATTYVTNSRMLFYLTVTETATGNIVAFETKYIYFNPSNVPTATFDVSVDGATVSVINYSLTGSYTNTNWSYGDGYTTEDYLPGPYTYAMPGTYTVNNTIFYGNKASCKVTFSESVILREDNAKDDFAPFVLFPNPTDNRFSILLPKTVQDGTVILFDTAGKCIWQQKFENADGLVEIRNCNVAGGMYIVEVSSDLYTQQSLIQIQ
jgi:hypothetical protein